jgi:FAD/FMN-containing dehydrogenase
VCRSWAGSIEFRPRRLVQVDTEEELVEAVTRAAAAGDQVRPIGALHSSSPLSVTEDVVISARGVRGMLEARPDRHQAVLGPGTDLDEAGEQLATVGLSMENLGDVSYQHVAGALATGTHGTGIRFGNLSTALVGGRLVTASGAVLPFGTESADGGDEPLLRAVRVSLGALGILSSLTLRVIPAVRLHRRNWMTGIDWVVANFEQLAAENRHFDFYWYPRSELAQVRTINQVGDEPGLVPAGEPKTESTGLGYRVIPNQRELRFEEMEYMLPMEDAMAMFGEVRDRIKKRHVANVGWRVLVRSVAGDDSMLSTCYGRPTMTIALLQNNTLPYEPYFSDLEPMLQAFGGRPHWGKKHTMAGARLAARYPEWEAFHSVRRRLDPDGVFLNDHLRALLGEDRT